MDLIKGNRGWLRQLRGNSLLYILLIPGLLYFIVFKYLPMFGLVVAFQDYSPFLGVWQSPWVGFAHFSHFLNDPYFLVLLKNTVLLAFYSLLFGFPAPIIFALFLNEVRQRLLKRFVQSFTFFPYFISTAVMVSLLYTLLSPQGGLVNQIIQYFGSNPVYFMSDPDYFRSLYVGLGIWHSFGQGAIVYLAAMSGIDPNLYEAAEIDGANRWKRMWHITLPSIRNVIIIMFILKAGEILSVDLDRILLMYNPNLYETADVIQTYVYRQGFGGNGFPDYSYAASVGLFQSVVALALIFIANQVAKTYSDTRLF